MREHPISTANGRRGAAMVAVFLVAAVLEAGVPAGPPVGDAARPANHTAEQVDSVVLFNTEAVPVTTTHTFLSSRWYRVVASGEVSDWTSNEGGLCDPGQGGCSEEPWGVDPLYCYAVWRCGEEPGLWRQLRIGEATGSAGNGLDEFVGRPGEIPYSPDHLYEGVFRGTDTRLELVALDAYNGSGSNNSGAFVADFYDLGPVGCTIAFSAKKVELSRSRLTKVTTKIDGAAHFPECPPEDRDEVGLWLDDDVTGSGVHVHAYDQSIGGGRDRARFRLTHSTVDSDGRGGLAVVVDGPVTKSDLKGCRAGRTANALLDHSLNGSRKVSFSCGHHGEDDKLFKKFVRVRLIVVIDDPPI